MSKFFKIGLAMALAGGLGAQAATDSTTFQVKITITESCDIHTNSATDVDFGSNARSDSVASATGTLKVQCTNGTPYTITLGNGAHYDTGTATRRMTDGTNFVPYTLYKSDGTTPWSGTTTTGGSGNGSVQNVSVIGKVAPGATNVPAGTYADTVTATISY